jgi:RNA polymerase sigma-70 factor (ECF subfamily)
MDALDVDALSRRYGPMVLRRCRQLLRNEDEALDACQDVFVSADRTAPPIERAISSSLLYRMANPTCA